jgi:hypothetical protein
VCDCIFERVQAWAPDQDDDRSVMVVRYTGA